MKHKQSINGFIEAMAGLVEQNASGNVVLISDMGDWGKLNLLKGEIFSIELGIYRGPQVLDYLQSMEMIQYMFRPDRETGATKRVQSPGSARMDNTQFFNFFDHVLPKIGQGNRPLASRTKRVTALAKILVVDDSALARKVVVNHLVAANFAVVEAKNGFEALGQLEQERPNLIILDLIMPGMDGYQVIDKMKSSEQFKHIPIIMVTSRDSLMDKLKGKMSATDAYITKPIDNETLIGKIHQLL